MKKRVPEITGFQLKMIAILSMVIDHIGAVILEEWMTHPMAMSLMQQVYDADRVLRSIGRLAFPLFCFFITEGLHYTRNRGKYALRLGIFALISEVPFDLAFQQSFFDLSYNNVMFTLLIGLLCIWGISALDEYLAEKFTTQSSLWALFYTLSVILISTAGCFGAELLHTDYGAGGVLAIIILYLLRRNRMLGMIVAVVSLALTSGWIELFALADVALVYFYHGTQGRRMKYFFYVFYPAHLLILAGIAAVMMNQ